jgi:hypothetical protein
MGVLEIEIRTCYSTWWLRKEIYKKMIIKFEMMKEKVGPITVE